MNIRLCYLSFLLALAVASCSPSSKSTPRFSIIPKPAVLEEKGGECIITGNTKIVAAKQNAECLKVAGYLKGFLGNSSEYKLALAEQAKSNYILLRIDSARFEQPEAYELDIAPDKIEITAREGIGLMHAVQTLRQLMPADIERAHRGELAVPCMKIQDAPRYAYRGMHLDVGRHMFPVKAIKKYIDLLALFKMNTFHWHLTEDQGWRIEIKKYPKLTEVGAYRNETLIGHYGDRHKNGYDGKPYGGFYTQEEIKEVVKYASERFVTVIPEIELPGHSIAALSAYPEFGCTGGPYEVLTRWGVCGEVYCAGNEKTFTFLEDVLSEVMALFPSKYIHIGGDECPKGRWAKCPKCQKRKKALGLGNEHELQSYFIKRIEKYLNAHGRAIIGWDEILEGGLAPNATVMSWRGMRGGIKAARQGHDVIMTPTTYCYFDNYQGKRELEPLAIGGDTDIQEVYSFDPTPAGFSAEEARHILGSQANVWTEYIPNEAHADYMIFPRLLALAEALWTPKEQKSWDDFAHRLPMHLDRLDVMNIQYARSIYGIHPKLGFDPDKKQVTVNLDPVLEGTEVRFTTDGTEPNSNSSVYTKPFSLKKNTVIKAASFENGKRIYPAITRDVKINKATGKKIKLHTKAAQYFDGYGRDLMLDNVRGSTNMGDKKWLGYKNRDLIATLDLIVDTPLESVNIGCLYQPNKRLFLPGAVEISVSSDGENYKKFTEKRDFGVSSDLKDGIYELNIPCKATARYIKIHAKNFGDMPDWTRQRGRTYLFVDEIILK
ncbi:MAG: glycoside hydrolase family 20 protein [Cytophagales bacterium]|nr:glycoside hydrolase family 20 protein [Cytophagales bacterium]